jgi:hypothetical protein
VAKGSLRNKAMLVPAALAISVVAPWAVTPLLMLGGAYLCFEGFEKIAHRFVHGGQEDQAHRQQLQAMVADPQVDLLSYEKDKIRGAIRTDFILSAEIIAITLGSVAAAPFISQLLVVSGIALVMTVGVYGLVAGIVKLDDLGLYLGRRPQARMLGLLGAAILWAAPHLMKSLSVLGTAAMFLVGGGILSHGLAGVHHAFSAWAEAIAAWPVVGGSLATALPWLLNLLLGVLMGALALGLVSVLQRLRGRMS